MAIKRKKILCFVTGTGLGGVAIAFTAFAKALEECGFDVKALLLYEKNVYETPIPQKYICGFVFKKPIKNKILRLVVQVFNLLTRRYFYFKFVKYIEHDIFVVYQALGCSHWYKYTKCPKFVFFHQIQQKPKKGWFKLLFHRIYAYRYNLFTERIAISNSIAQSVQEVYGIKGMPVVISNLLSINEIVEKSSEKQDRIKRKDRLQFVCVARLSPEKGVLRLLRVAKRLRRQGYCDFDLFLIGSGPLFKEIEQEICRNHHETWLHLLGPMSNPYPYIKAADMLILPSYEEGLGLVLWEALLLETPVLATRSKGALEALCDGEWGRLVENTEEGLYDGMKLTLERYAEFSPFVDFKKVRIALEQRNQIAIKALCTLFDNEDVMA